MKEGELVADDPIGADRVLFVRHGDFRMEFTCVLGELGISSTYLVH